ncbi:hypothetical protein Nepgr_028940 [Nepenthes gracilis]|uniref:Uncharacterized protein n=1 Tax=Nepenthes gracilis TaxID=150966 RepID=A0AAD3TD13_NEPGR|nr:hypothetical protein Nepgr_028940 [Nepenthes gracilis]
MKQLGRRHSHMSACEALDSLGPEAPFDGAAPAHGAVPVIPARASPSLNSGAISCGEFPSFVNPSWAAVVTSSDGLESSVEVWISYHSKPALRANGRKTIAGKVKQEVAPKELDPDEAPIGAVAPPSLDVQIPTDISVLPRPAADIPSYLFDASGHDYTIVEGSRESVVDNRMVSLRPEGMAEKCCVDPLQKEQPADIDPNLRDVASYEVACSAAISAAVARDDFHAEVEDQGQHLPGGGVLALDGDGLVTGLQTFDSSNHSELLNARCVVEEVHNLDRKEKQDSWIQAKSRRKRKAAPKISKAS